MGEIQARAHGAAGVARRFASEADRMPRTLEDAQREIAEDAEDVYQAFALFRTGRMARSIRSMAVAGAIVVRADARNPQTGYDYVGVTRLGHRAARIYPRHDRSPASVIGTRRGRRRGAHAALRFTIGGRVLFRRWVRGFHPKTDWAEDAFPVVEQRAAAVATRTGHQIVVRLGG